MKDLKTWIFNHHWYYSEPTDWENFDLKNPVLVYNPKWDKCFNLISLQYSGNNNRLKAYIEDIYTKRYYYVEAKTVELVKELM